MNVPALTFEVAVADLRPGLYVHLALGWMDHPFPTNRFLIKGPEQIQTLRELGLQTVSVQAARCDPAALALLQACVQGATAKPPVTVSHPTPPAPAAPAATGVEAARARHRELLQLQQNSLQRSQRLHGKAVQGWLDIARDALREPALAAEAAQDLSAQLVSELQGSEDTTVRVLSEAAGTGPVQHAINVSVLSLMLGRSLGLGANELRDVAVGALLHDIGKLMLPDVLRNVTSESSALYTRARREHVAQGVRLGMTMGLSPAALRVIAQHHELQDGSGLPQGLTGEEITLPARIVALTDTYDKLCNPSHGGSGRTPHEAQALMYAQMREQLDTRLLGAFIKMIGVYPPGSVVELVDGRHAMVVSTHPQQPLKPCVLVHEPRVPREEALLIDLLRTPSVGIRRSLHPQHLARATLDYLSPATRLHYYFAQELGAPALAQA
jgi:putative nucleotidyltransferase with HDIG domain